ncbi:restriction endonuclease subunit S [Nitrosopumilus oxyclinae]|uniref:restriction endonuclease subunit S n=1 Tax=Nitrosopumilus oxyclinae TaxID=1959104 RepID=UPI0015CB2ADC|nr:restriction endonuclease subunit S [Nitrosopumilus oxyclinae]
MEKNKLPEGWTSFRYDEYLTLHYGKGLTKRTRNSHGKIPVYGSSGMIGYHDEPLVSNSSLIIGRKGNVGEIYYEENPSWAIDTAYFLSEYPMYDLKFLYFLLKHMKLNRLNTSTAVPSLRRDDVYKSQMLLPPLNEQKRIVKKIEELYLKTESILKLLYDIKSQLMFNRKSLLNSAFNGLLTKKWRERNSKTESISILLKQINPTWEKLTKKILENSKKIPNTWEYVKIDDIAELVGGGTPSRKNLEYFGGKITWLTPTEIPRDKITFVNSSKETITELGLKKSSAKIIPKNSVLLTSRATIGNIAISTADVTTNQGFASFVCSKIIDNRYLAYWLFANRKLLQDTAKGTTFKEISKSKIKELFLPLAPLIEQKLITEIVDEEISLIEKNENTIEQSIKLISAFKSSILKQAFEGKLVSQDPGDESVEILLEKIKS